MKRLAVAMNRREFLKKAGVGSMAFASLPTLAPILARPAWTMMMGERTSTFCRSARESW